MTPFTKQIGLNTDRLNEETTTRNYKQTCEIGI
jgi:hypothetical protein